MLPAVIPREESPLTQPAPKRFEYRILSPPFWVALIVVIGVIDVWGSRFNLNPDGISYIEMARHAVAGAPDGFINGYWSPGYPALLAPVLWVIRPDWVTAVPALHLVNFVLYLVAAWFALRLFRLASAPGLARYVTAVAATAFTVIAIECIGLGFITPDVGVMLVVLMTAWCCVQIERSDRASRWSIALGIVLGLGYWLKGILLPLNAMLLFALLVFPPNVDRARKKIGMAVLVFVVTSLPLIAMVSHKVGRTTMGEVGKLNYAWEVDGVTPFTGWIGDSVPRFGAPVHPPRVLQSEPQTLEFVRPIRATYALWFDPSYWYAGIEPHFDATGQWRVLRRGLHDLASLAHVQWLLLISVVVLWFGSARPIERRTNSRIALVLACWSIAAALVYALVHVEPRYLAGFFLVGVVAVWSWLSQRTPRRGMPWAMGAVIVALLVSLARNIGGNTGGFQVDYRPDYLLDGEKLRSAGIAPGDPVAMVGDAFEAYAAFAIGSPIVVQVMDSTGYWNLTAAARAELQGRLSGAGVKAMLANNVDAARAAEGWRILSRADSSNLGVLLLRRQD